MSAPRPLKVLYHLHPLLDTLDLTGPLEILSHAIFPSSPSTQNPPTPRKIFASTLTSSHSMITTDQHLTITPDISLSEAYATLSTYDILVIPGGGSPGVLKDGKEPMGLIRAFCELPRKERSGEEEEEEGKDLLNGERILFSVCTGSLFLATAGVLDSPEVRCTTHPNYYQKLRDILSFRTRKREEGGEGPRKGEGEGDGKVTKDRFVVNKVDEKGVRIVTCGGVTSGFHGALWLVGLIGGEEVRKKVEEIVVFEGVEGLVL